MKILDEKIQDMTKQRMEVLVRQMQERQGVTEQLKAENQLQWVGMMNNISQAAEEVILKELVYG